MGSLADLSRREFLKLCGGFSLSLAGLYSPWKPQAEQSSSYLGRILTTPAPVYDQAGQGGRLVRQYWLDVVLPVREVVVGEDNGYSNRFWYRLDDGYIHSSHVQLVEICENQPQTVIPPQGRLAEVTVPFTDSRWDFADPTDIAYRLYYGTTFWVLAACQDQAGTWYYRLLEDKWKKEFYAKATHLRPIPLDELTPIHPEAPSETKRIEVDLGHQLVSAYEGGRVVFMARTSSGARFSDGNFETPRGRFITDRKRPTRHMAAGDLADGNGYDLPGVPWVSYFTPSGISFHGTFWHNEFGRPRSHGCLNMSIADARWIYRWSLPIVPLTQIEVAQTPGTMIDIFG